jgi:hypothetical protein
MEGKTNRRNLAVISLSNSISTEQTEHTEQTEQTEQIG